MPSSSTNVTGLQAQNRFITEHDDKGLSVISTQIDEQAVYDKISPSLDFFLAYSNNFTPNLNNSADLASYKAMFEAGQPPISIPGGTVLRVCNLAPKWTSPMHRTTSLDFGIVVEGEAELLLDSGEVRSLKVGDIAVQRGTMHAWRNPSAETWSRMIFILQHAQELEVAGKKVGDDYGGIEVPTVGEYEKGKKSTR